MTPERIEELRRRAAGKIDLDLSNVAVMELINHIDTLQSELQYNTPVAGDLTERMIDAPRQFLLFYAGAKRAVRTKEMRAHLDMSGVDYSCWPEWALTDDVDITKAGAAILIWTMMQAAAPATAHPDTADAIRYRKLVHSGKFVPALHTGDGWGLRAGGEAAIKPELDAAADELQPATTPTAIPLMIPDVDWLAAVIREVDGNHDLGAGLLAEAIIKVMTDRNVVLAGW